MSSSWTYDHGLKSSLVHGESPLKLSGESAPRACINPWGMLLAHIVFLGDCEDDLYFSCSDCGGDVLLNGIPSVFMSSVGNGDLYDYEHPVTSNGCKYAGELMAVMQIAGEIALYSLRNVRCTACGVTLEMFYSPNNPRWKPTNNT